jgi:hypothetical protein
LAQNGKTRDAAVHTLRGLDRPAADPSRGEPISMAPAGTHGELRMTQQKALIVAMVLGLSSGAANAAGLDGTRNLVCAAMEVVACAGGVGCIEGSARAFDLPEFMFVDVKEKVVHAHTEGDPRKVVSPIRVAEKTKTQLVMQGIENGHGWSMSIDQTSGRMTTTVAGESASFMIFGACTAL